MANTRKVLLSLHIEVADRLDQELNKSELIDVLAAAHYGLRFEGDSTAAMKRQTMLDKLNAVSTETVAASLPEPMTVPVADEHTMISNEDVFAIANEELAKPDLVELELAPEPENVIPTTTTVPVLESVELSSDVNDLPPALVAFPGGDTQPPAFVPVAPDTGFVPQVQPLEAVQTIEPELPIAVSVVEPVIIPDIAPVVEPVQSVEVAPAIEVVPVAVETPPVISVQVAPGTTLDPQGHVICPTCKLPMLTPVCLNCLL